MNTQETKIPTNKGAKAIDEIFDILNYSSYRANRGYGLSHEQLVQIGIGKQSYKERYENSQKLVTNEQR